MAEVTTISWTDHSFSPWWGCQKWSKGCEECYAESTAKRFGRNVWGPKAPRLVVADSTWKNPLTWNQAAEKADRHALVFCGSMCDVFEDHPTCNATRPRLWELIRNTPRLSWQVLTHRPENIVAMLPDDWGAGYPNVWLGAHNSPTLIRRPSNVESA
jgi:protein gp37